MMKFNENLQNMKYSILSKRNKNDQEYENI